MDTTIVLVLSDRKKPRSTVHFKIPDEKSPVLKKLSMVVRVPKVHCQNRGHASSSGPGMSQSHNVRSQYNASMQASGHHAVSSSHRDLVSFVSCRSSCLVSDCLSLFGLFLFFLFLFFYLFVFFPSSLSFVLSPCLPQVSPRNMQIAAEGMCASNPCLACLLLVWCVCPLVS